LPLLPPVSPTGRGAARCTSNPKRKAKTKTTQDNQQNATSSPDVLAALTQAILTDDMNQSDRLVRLYESSDMDEKDLIDRLLIIICGYSMPTLIEKSESL
jgi:hypothetical protein